MERCQPIKRLRKKKIIIRRRRSRRKRKYNVEKYCTAEETTDDNTRHARCKLGA